MKKLFIVGAIFFSCTIAFAVPPVKLDDFKSYQLAMIEKERQCLKNSKTLEGFKNCKFEAMKEIKFKILQEKESCIKNAKDVRELRICDLYMKLLTEMP